MLVKVKFHLHFLWLLLLVVSVIGQNLPKFCRSCPPPDTSNCNHANIGAFQCQNDTDSCYVRNLNGQIDRGCMQAIGSDRQRCLDPSDLSCLTCPDLLCNDDLWPTCHVCQESTDPTCRGEQSGVGTFCERYNAPGSCFERIVNGSVERGCRSDVVGDPCAGNEHCRVFEGSASNGHAVREFQVTKCVQCRADDLDVDRSCLSGSKGLTSCVGPSDGRCYSRILDGGILERGCQGNLTLDEVQRCNGTMCGICIGDGCNSGIFPEDRLRCNECNSGNTSDCNIELTDASKSVICKIYTEDNMCYSAISSNQTFERGCLSDVSNSSCIEDDNCIQCVGNNCNRISEQTILNYPKCLRCTSDEDGCSEGNMTASKCDHPDDSCFTRVKDSVLERNCLSTLSPTDRTKCTTAEDKSCVVCPSRGCNNQRWPTCHVCEETTNSTCPLEQIRSGSFCKNHKEQAECFEQFVQGNVQRGCVSDLIPAFDPCLSNGKCKSCTGNDCNKERSDRFQNVACLQCTADGTDSDGSCLLGTQVSQSCEDRSNGGCFTWINGGILLRGCQSDFGNTTQCNGTTCRSCDEEGCNSGIFPQNRLECYQCKGQDCGKESTQNTTSAICRIFKSDNKCFSRISAEGVFERGCQYDLINGSNPCSGLENCILCTGSKCNTVSETQLKAHPKCLRCTSSNQNCVGGLLNATSCDQLNDSCFTRVKDGILERNCLSSLKDTDITKCNNTEDQSCQICSGPGCNNHEWPKCHQCSATDCNSDQPASKSQFCPEFNLHQCYEKLEAINVTRGCANVLIEDPCKDSLECKLCDTASCNNRSASTLVTNQRCLQCNSTEDSDGICLEGRMQEAPCRTESGQQCYSRVDDDGVLHRGCRGDLAADEIAACSGVSNCTICTGTGCNGNVFPPNRLRCHRCNSLLDKQCSNQLTGNATSSYCEVYSPYDSCYTRIRNDILERGCQSDLENSACIILDKKHCQTCEGNNCNEISKTKLKNSARKLDQTAWITIAMLTVLFHLL
ncbi:uncharacterized protein LOC120415390 isoform X2 [Culex pipiens pallens]|uniref:uncharacterized protein LOC120415390 isoform X2 n=1 Tax=Culex pipiens pallens TaxID=42434 RepID=UPI0022AA324E|nr:uncharacterized protein LOC120415390 isoform X2 [Culex pipiens pallens]